MIRKKKKKKNQKTGNVPRRGEYMQETRGDMPSMGNLDLISRRIRGLGSVATAVKNVWVKIED